MPLACNNPHTDIISIISIIAQIVFIHFGALSPCLLSIAVKTKADPVMTHKGITNFDNMESTAPIAMAAIPKIAGHSIRMIIISRKIIIGIGLTYLAPTQAVSAAWV